MLYDFGSSILGASGTVSARFTALIAAVCKRAEFCVLMIITRFRGL